ncbi:collectrin [Discoglossus pictus]
MLKTVLICSLCLVTVSFADLCKPDAPGAFKVRLSIKKALGDKAYKWNTDEEFLFKAMMAFTMRSYTQNDTFQISNILLCNVTERISFWFVVTSPSNASDPFPSATVEEAIRSERNRINSAFLLDDKNLEFVSIPPTLVPITESSNSTWLIVFGVIISVVGVTTVYLITSGMIHRRKKRKARTSEEEEDSEDRMKSVETNANGVYFNEGLENCSYENNEEGSTPF